MIEGRERNTGFDGRWDWLGLVDDDAGAGLCGGGCGSSEDNAGVKLERRQGRRDAGRGAAAIKTDIY